jgi:hypothetical protein
LCSAFYRTLSLLPIAGIVDGFGLNAELSAELFYQCLCPFYLEVGWVSGFAVGYNTDSDGLAVAVPSSTRYARPLFLPFFSWLYLAIAAAEPITNDKVAVDILRACQTVQ